MRFDKSSGSLQLSATDLASFLGCHHRTALEMGHAYGTREKPQYDDPSLEALFARGLEHEAAYVDRLRADGASVVVEIKNAETREPRDVTLARTIDAMREGADVIVQGALGNERWFGYADVLIKTERPSGFGDWSYEVVDTKLSRDTKAGTVLQLALYSVLLESVQGARPEHFYVVTPDTTETYRLDDYAAYFRLIRARLDEAARQNDVALAAAHYPEPVDHCDICPWSGQCRAERRKDDHLSLVAGISRTQRRELTMQSVVTTASLAEMPIHPMAFKPKRGAPETYERVREQARVQVAARTTGEPVVEFLPVVPPTADEPGQGLCRLPEPTDGDLFLDLEGDPFAGPTSGPPMLRGREYLFGVVTADGGYQAFWAENADQEKTAFESVVDLIERQKRTYPAMHVFHYAPYEPSAFKRLMGRHATREMSIDAFLRSETFVDLYAVVRQSLRAGVERYSIKNLEQFYDFTRDVDLRAARVHLQAMERAVELERIRDLRPEVRAAVEGYNRDDCVSTLRLRDWLEAQRARLVTDGVEIPRPVQKPGAPSEPLAERQAKIEALRSQLLASTDASHRLMAYLVDWHRREDKATWWEYFRLLALTEDELLDERGAVAGLEFVEVVRPEKKSQIQRYRYPPQEMELRRKAELHLNDQKRWCEVIAVDRIARTIDVLVGPSRAASRPTAAFEFSHVRTGVLEDALMAIGESIVVGQTDPVATALLHRSPPTTRVATELKHTVLAIQGPPGTGKTYTGGKMICDLLKAGKKVGIAATGHKVIRNLLDAVAYEAEKQALTVTLAHKTSSDEGGDDDHAGPVAVLEIADNKAALQLLTSGEAQVLGGTAWMWTRPEFRKCVDVLFIDEAGQMSLANALAMTQSADALVLLGDPQQLDQPQKGTHPAGVGVSALEHILGEHQTMPEALGMFLADTWRFGAPICDFTSEVFYERKLAPTTQKHLERQRLDGGPITGAGLFVVEVAHEGNRNGSEEEVEAVASLVQKLLAKGSTWTDDAGTVTPLGEDDILVVSPYNVQVSRLQERLAQMGAASVAVGTVDKFQGKQAPVVIYSMATSRPEDAPRGMEFLYSLNRLNVATSRARCAAVVVASPNLFEPECKTPRQIQLANGLCRFREMATTL